MNLKNLSTLKGSDLCPVPQQGGSPSSVLLAQTRSLTDGPHEQSLLQAVAAKAHRSRY